VLVLSKAREGRLHDKRFHDEDDIAGSVPDAISIEVDLGFRVYNSSMTTFICHIRNREARIK